MRTVTRLLLVACILLAPALLLAQAGGAQDKAPTLSDLLNRVRTGWAKHNEEITQREAQFLAEKNQRVTMLKEAKARLASEQKRGETLEKEFNGNESKITQLEETLRIRLGTMATWTPP